MEKELKNIKRIGVALAALILLSIGLRLWLNYQRSQISPSKKETPWKGLDVRQVAGKPADSCLCTQINGKLYKVNPREKIYFTYTPIK